MKIALACLLLLAATTTMAAVRADRVLVLKSARVLHLYQGPRLLASYPVALGFSPLGHKRQEGDGRTPEGRYVLDVKKADSGYYKAIHISYPDARDLAAARQRGVAAGGAVMLHGQRNGFGWASWLTQRRDWTHGCIALSNADMEAVWQAVDAGTAIEIRP